jgi:hypothetical protein
MKIGKWCGRLGLVSATAIVAVAVLHAGNAVAAADGPYCAILVGKAPAGKESPVLAQVCSDTSAAQAESMMLAKAGVPASTLLMTMFENVDYNSFALPGPGNARKDVFGSAGPCDSAGYRLGVDIWWSVRVSSILGANNCNVARVYNQALNDADDFGMRLFERGTWLERFNDNVGRFQVHS